jgi:hypothetical protein
MHEITVVQKPSGQPATVREVLAADSATEVSPNGEAASRPRQGAHLSGISTSQGRSYGKKRDAIDTTKSRPAADCVSETLETLDERWKQERFDI